MKKILTFILTSILTLSAFCQSIHVPSGIVGQSLSGKSYIGIGDSNPVSKLHISSLSYVSDQIFDPSTNILIENTSNAWRTSTGIRFKNFKGNFTLGLYGNNNDINNTFRIYNGDNLNFIIDQNGSIGIGNSSNSKLHLNATSYLEDQIFDPSTNILIENNSTAWRTSTGIRFKNFKGDFTMGIYGKNDSNNNTFRIYNGNNLNFTIDQIGRVGIGTSNPDSELTVNGTIHANEVIVDLNVPAPDYVFEDDYELQSLQDIKEYISINKHLPEIPSALDISKKGIDLGDMNMKLLKKVEELTLHMIRIEEELQKLKKENSELKQSMDLN